METLAPPSPSRSPSRMSRRWARKCERYCCIGVTYFPLAFVYSLTTWAVWVEATLGFVASDDYWIGKGTSFLGIALFILLNWSYTTAVFTDPGSTTENQNGYSSLPTHGPSLATSFTVKSTGEMRFCKKCQARKPDRAHHCSSCRKCILKMDHHCPWLATCVGLRNYKAFLLFLIYTTIFCFVCFAVSARWAWTEILSDGRYIETMMPINYVMLAVTSGIIGLVLAGFTGWHISLASRGQTTIECLEKTRYLSPLRQSMKRQHIAQHQGEGNGSPSYSQQLRDVHANPFPGETRPGEGEVRLENDQTSNRPIQLPSYDALERFRARERYEEYLDEQDSSKLPNAFNLGWRKNLSHLFGPKPLLWWFPICNTTGDGYSWEPSPKWLAARDKLRLEREDQEQRERAAGWGSEAHYDRVPARASQGAGRHYLSYPSPAPSAGTRSPSKADRILGRDPSQYADAESFNSGEQNGISMNNLRLGSPYNDSDDFDRDDDGDGDGDGYEGTSDERDAERKLFNGVGRIASNGHGTGGTWRTTKIAPPASSLLGARSPSPTKGQGDDWGKWDGAADEGVD